LDFIFWLDSLIVVFAHSWYALWLFKSHRAHTGGMCFQLSAVTGFGQQNAINQAAVISPNKKICNPKGCRFSGAGYCLFNWPAPFEQPSR
jgi:hypothetical protein